MDLWYSLYFKTKPKYVIGCSKSGIVGLGSNNCIGWNVLIEWLREFIACLQNISFYLIKGTVPEKKTDLYLVFGAPNEIDADALIRSYV